MDTSSHRPDFRRTVRTFVLRAGRMTATQQKDYQELSGRWCIPYSGTHLNYTYVFGNANPVTVEIGFGMGRATALIAEANPGTNYLGLEVHRPGVGKLLGEIRRRKLENIRIVQHDALEVLEAMVPDGSVSAFHIFFPDPWPKKRHHKRRLVQRPHTDLIARKLAPDGYLCMATDWEPYAEFALEQLERTPGLENRYEGFAPRQEWRPETRFEEKGLDKNHVIRELFFIRQEDNNDA